MECLERCTYECDATHETPRKSKHASCLLTPEISTASSAGTSCILSPEISSNDADLRTSLSAESSDGDSEMEVLVEGACQVCEENAVWVAVCCSAESCLCEDTHWGLCEPCCEKLLHEECLTKQVQERQLANAHAACAEAEASGSAEYEAMEMDFVEVDGWRFNPSTPAFDPSHGCMMEYQEMEFASQYSMPQKYVPTLDEVRMSGGNLNHVCVHFAANGTCPRGDSCRWIHCIVHQ